MDEQLSYANDDDGVFKRSVIRGIERASGRRHLNALLNTWKVMPGGEEDVHRRMLQVLNINFDPVGHWPIRDLPDGPILIVANHPYGLSDGLILGAIAETLGRPNRLIVNAQFLKVPEFRPFMLPIDFTETREAVATNLATKNNAIRLLREGVTVGIFPSGGVATAPRGFGQAEELPWKSFLPRLIQAAKANVLPVYIDGQNSLLFHMTSRMSQSLRIALLVRELKRQLETTVTVRIGQPLPWETLSEISDRKALLEFVQNAVLAHGPSLANQSAPSLVRARQKHRLWKATQPVRKPQMKPHILIASEARV